MAPVSESRSKIMRSVRSKNTTPEIFVRKIVFGLGYRYRLNVKTLIGSPDIVLRRLRKVIFVHGCFWHGHDCPKGNLPKSNIDFWAAKILRNQQRDSQNVSQLKMLGWRTLVIWQCELKKRETLQRKIDRFLNKP